MTDPWNGARTAKPTPARVRLALLLLVTLALPLAIVALGSRQPAVETLEVAAPRTQAVAATDTLVELSTSQSTEPTTVTTEAPTTTQAPTTTAKPTTTTTAKPTSTTAKPTTTTTAARAVVRAVPDTTSAPPPPPAPPTTQPSAYDPGGNPTASESAFLACVRRRESGGNYGAVSPDGLYMGAYQFHQTTWNNSTYMANRGHLAGHQPHLVGAADQDAVALALYRNYGASPWGGSCY